MSLDKFPTLIAAYDQLTTCGTDVLDDIGPDAVETLLLAVLIPLAEGKPLEVHPSVLEQIALFALVGVCRCAECWEERTVEEKTE